MENVKQLLPKEGREIITKALQSYQHSLELMNCEEYDSLNDEHFDCYGLIGLMQYDVEISLPKEIKECFVSKYNVDFPMFGEVIFRRDARQSSLVCGAPEFRGGPDIFPCDLSICDLAFHDIHQCISSSITGGLS